MLGQQRRSLRPDGGAVGVAGPIANRHAVSPNVTMVRMRRLDQAAWYLRVCCEALLLLSISCSYARCIVGSAA
jgi:hypothetical protein